jgi:hypothetical protein
VADPGGFKKIHIYEKEFNYTIHQKETIDERANRGTPYKMDAFTIEWAMNTVWYGQIIKDTYLWKLPKGAFGESCGPS